MVFLMRLCLEQNVADSLHDPSEAKPRGGFQVLILLVAPRLCVGLELDEEHSPPVSREEYVVDLHGRVAPVLRPDEVSLDRQLRQHFFLERDARQLLDDAFQVGREEDIGSSLQLVRGQVTPPVQVVENAVERIHRDHRSATPSGSRRESSFPGALTQ